MRVIYNYIPETNRVSTVYNVATVLYLQFVLHVTSLRPVTVALSVGCMQCPIWLFFCSSLILCFPGMWFRYGMSYFERRY